MADNTRKETAYNICKRVLGSSGLPIPAAIVGSTDALAVQLLGLFNEGGQELLAKPWKFLDRTFQLDTVPGTLEYDLPSDWDRWIDDTDWNSTSRLPLVFVNPQQWAYLKATTLGSTTFQLQYKMEAGKLKFYQVPSAPQTLQIAYRSRGWVAKAIGGDYADNIQDNGDVVQYPSQLAVAMLKFKLREAKGYDTVTAKDAFDAALDAALNADTIAGEISMSRGGTAFLGSHNLPETGYGS